MNIINRTNTKKVELDEALIMIGYQDLEFWFLNNNTFLKSRSNLKNFKFYDEQDVV